MNILNLKVGKIRKLTVKSIRNDTIKKIDNGQEKLLDKIIFETEDPYTQKQFSISDAWVDTANGIKIKGLWLSLQNGEAEIQKHSNLAKLLEHYKIETLQDFIGKTVDAYPDEKNFLVLVACNLPENM